MLHGQLQEGHERERKPKGVVNGFRENSGRVPGEFRAGSGRIPGGIRTGIRPELARNLLFESRDPFNNTTPL